MTLPERYRSPRGGYRITPHIYHSEPAAYRRSLPGASSFPDRDLPSQTSPRESGSSLPTTYRTTYRSSYSPPESGDYLGFLILPVMTVSEIVAVTKGMEIAESIKPTLDRQYASYVEGAGVFGGMAVGFAVTVLVTLALGYAIEPRDRKLI